MGDHIRDGQFQSDKYPTTPRGMVPLSIKDPTAQDLLWEYAERRRSKDNEFSNDLQACLTNAGYESVLSNHSFTEEEAELIKSYSRDYLTAVYSIAISAAEFDYNVKVYTPKAVEAAAAHVLALRKVKVK